MLEFAAKYGRCAALTADRLSGQAMRRFGPAGKKIRQNIQRRSQRLSLLSPVHEHDCAGHADESALSPFADEWSDAGCWEKPGPRVAARAGIPVDDHDLEPVDRSDGQDVVITVLTSR